MQDEREPLRRRQRLEHDQERQADGVGEHRLLLGVEMLVARDDRVGQPSVLEEILAPGAPRAEHVQRDPRHDGREPAAQVLDPGLVGAAQAQPGLLHRVLGLRHGPEHPIGDRLEVGAVCLELARQVLVVRHADMTKQTRPT